MANNGKMSDERVAARSEICSLIELRLNNRYDDPPLKSITRSRRASPNPCASRRAISTSSA